MKKTPQKLSNYEQYKFDSHLSMDKHWFDAFFEPHYRFVEKRTIYWETGEDKKLSAACADIYVIQSSRTTEDEKKIPAIYCFLVFFKGRVWKIERTSEFTELFEILEKYHERRKFEIAEIHAKAKKEVIQFKKKNKGIRTIGKRKKVA